MPGNQTTLCRHRYVPDGSCFFTVALPDRRSDALVRHVDRLRKAFRGGKRDSLFEMPAVDFACL